MIKQWIRPIVQKMRACKVVKCKDCKYWQLEDELPWITEFMECTRVDESDPDWWKKYHFRGPDDSCKYGEKRDEVE